MGRGTNTTDSTAEKDVQPVDDTKVLETRTDDGASKTNQDTVVAIDRGKDLVFRNVNVDIGGKKILKDVSGVARKGEMLAIMGPSGAGKTTLMNSLLLRVPMTSGHVTLNNETMTRRHCRKIAYCAQNDVFLPTLTLRETLYFRAELSLPEKMSRAAKEARIEDVTNILDLKSCLNTPIGNMFLPGLSGGQKRRASIACELLNDPQVMILDEPTSGLDSAIAYSMMESLRSHTISSNKTLLVSIHQPSTQIFYMFKSLLLVSDGQVAYYGKVDRLMEHFENIGLHCRVHYNPADFILEKLKDQKSKSVVMSSSSLDLQKSQWPQELTQGLAKEQTKEKDADNVEISIVNENGIMTIGYVSKGDGAMEIDIEPKRIIFDELSSTPEAESKTSRWPTTFWTQFKTLTQRQFKVSRKNIFNKFNFIKYTALIVYVSSAWWQVPRIEERLEDKFGLAFFPLTFFMFDLSVSAAGSFGPERGVIRKERASGLYRLSGYYFAKMTTELPMIFIYPGIFVVISYFACNLTLAPANFFGYIGIMWLSCLVSQGIGLLAAILFEDIRAALSLNILVCLPGLLASGFLARQLPSWLSWLQYVVYTQYCFRALNLVEFQYGDPIRCAPANQTMFEFCKQESNTTLYIPQDQILNGIQTELPLWANVSIMFGIFVFIRILGYIAFRLFRKPVGKGKAKGKK